MYEKDFVNINIRERYEAEYRFPPYKRQLMLQFEVGENMTYDPNDLSNKFSKTLRLDINSPRDIEALRQDVLFKNCLVDLHNYRQLRVFRLNQTIDKLNALIEAIDKEIKR